MAASRFHDERGLPVSTEGNDIPQVKGSSYRAEAYIDWTA